MSRTNPKEPVVLILTSKGSGLNPSKGISKEKEKKKKSKNFSLLQNDTTGLTSRRR